MDEVPIQPQPQVTTTPKTTNWKKIGLTIVFIVVCVSIIAGIYWFFVLNKTSEDSDLTGPIPKVTTKTATESAKEATSSAEKDGTVGWKTFTSTAFKYSIKYPSNWSLSKKSGFIDEAKTTPFENVHLSSVGESKSSLAIRGNFQSSWCSSPDTTKLCKEEESTLAGVKVKKWIYIDTETEVYLFQLENDSNIVMMTTPAGNKGLIDKILSTFKFLN